VSAAQAQESSAAAYDAIIRLAERELELAGEGRYAEVRQLSRQSAQILAGLGPIRPPGARDALERALALQRRISIELLRHREAILINARRIELSKRAAHGYGSSLPAALNRPRIRVDG
jgi:hypothetical protein